MADTPAVRARLIRAIRKLHRRPRACLGTWAVLQAAYGRAAINHLDDIDTLNAMMSEGVLCHWPALLDWAVAEDVPPSPTR